MTRPTSPLVLDGSQVKLRLTAERAATGSPVHVDWVRFTTARRNAPTPHVDLLFPLRASAGAVWDEVERSAQIARILSTLPDAERDAATEARELAQQVAAALGPDFSVASDVRKGHDFYRFRWAILRNEAECGWVGFLASSDSPRQQNQAKTLHANVFGAACTFAADGWTVRLANLIDSCKGDLTRCDLAADFFDGIEGGMVGVLADYESGRMDVGGRRLKCNMVGDWTGGGRGRSFYTGSKEAGKQTNVYEKGDQLFGVEEGSPWVRIELRYGNKLRELSTDMLRHPADFFAGASEWHALMVAKLGAEVAAQRVPTRGRLPLECVEAEVARNMRWTRDTAAPSLAVLVQHAEPDRLWDLLGSMKLPARLRKFSPAELARAIAERFSMAGGAGPAFA